MTKMHISKETKDILGTILKEKIKTAPVTILRKLECDVFVIPNRIGKISDNYFGEKLRKRFEEIYSFNELTLHDGEEYQPVQLWMTSELSENWNDHGFSIDYDGWNYKFMMDTYLPSKLFEGKKEGDVVNVTLPFKPRHKTRGEFGKDMEMVDWFDEENQSEPCPTFWLDITFHLNQKDYRYNRFGNFEDALKYAID